jgi:hypothetical protein
VRDVLALGGIYCTSHFRHIHHDRVTISRPLIARKRAANSLHLHYTFLPLHLISSIARRREGKRGGAR